MRFSYFKAKLPMDTFSTLACEGISLMPVGQSRSDSYTMPIALNPREAKFVGFPVYKVPSRTLKSIALVTPVVNKAMPIASLRTGLAWTRMD
jgi:hypothetical protein